LTEFEAKMRTRVVWLMVIAVMSVAAPAVAEQGGRDAARRHYAEGQALFRARSYDAALAEFRAANDLAPHPITIKAQAECLERLGRMREAVPLFEQYLAQMPNAPDAADIRARIGSYQTQGGRVSIYSNPPGAAVTLDGRRLNGTTPMQVDVAPGRHAVALEMNGYQMGLEEFNVGPGGAYTVNTAMVPAASAAPTAPVYPPPGMQPAPTQRAWSVTTPVWAMIGVTAAALVTGVVTGSLALADQGDFDDQIAAEGVTSANRQDLVDIGDTGTTKALVSDICWGVAGAAAITGIVLFFVQNHQAQTSGQAASHRSFAITPSFDEDGGGLQAVGHF
jgi:hypothetical protein